MKLLTIVGVLLVSTSWQRVDGLVKVGMPALVSQLPDLEFINLDSMKCREPPSGTTFSMNQRLGCWILANGKTFFASPAITADLSSALPKMDNMLYNSTGMYEAARRGCFSLTGMNGDVERNKYSYSSLDGYKSQVTHAANLDVSGKASYMMSAVSASYTSGQDSEKKVNSKFSYAKSHIRSEIKMGKVTNNCIGNRMQQFIKPSALELWNDILKSPHDLTKIGSFNSQFRALHADTWLLGGIAYAELKVTILDGSSFDSEAMAKGVKAAADVKIGGVGIDITGEMKNAFKKETENSTMTTESNTAEGGVAPCEPIYRMLRGFDLTPEEYGALKAQAAELFVRDFESWTPIQVIGYTSTLNMMLTAGDRLNNPGLGAILGKALHEANVKCMRVKVQGYRLIRNSTTASGKSYVYTLNCGDDFGPWKTNYCRFEQGSSTPVILERGSGNGTSNLNSYSLHYVSRPDYVSGVPTADLTLCGHPTRRLCAAGRQLGLPEELLQSFRYNDTSAAFSVVSPDPKANHGITSFPGPAKYNIPNTSRMGYHFFLNSDAQLMGTWTSSEDILNQHTYFEAVKGVRSSIDGQRTDLCIP
mmetsp:Transcript_9258/g.17506  ORF Transcript_9258/g.17506 Transcript_9258/m.17506 type:complete len:590 (+) Transcript_9258:157-1926(+)